MVTMAEVLAAHQQDYALLTVRDPHSVCVCGERTPVELPAAFPHISSAESEALRLVPHFRHQDDMLAAAGFGDMRRASVASLTGAAQAFESIPDALLTGKGVSIVLHASAKEIRERGGSK